MKIDTPLYELRKDYLAALEFLTDPENEVDAQTIADTMEAIEGTLDEKALNVARFYEHLNAYAKAAKDAETRIANRRKALENRVTSMKEYLRINMELAGKTKIEDAEFSISLQANPEAVKVTDECLIPEIYFDVVPATQVLNKTRLKEALKEHPVDGAELVRGNHIRIR